MGRVMRASSIITWCLLTSSLAFAGDDEPAPPPTAARMWHADDVQNDEALQPGDRRRRVNLAHGTRMSAAVVLQEEQFPFHCHAKHDEVLYAMTGTGTFRLGDQLRRVRPGDIVWVPHDV